MAADIFTKAFVSKEKWDHAIRLINIIDPKELASIIRDAGMTTEEAANVTGAGGKSAAPADPPPAPVATPACILPPPPPHPGSALRRRRKRSRVQGRDTALLVNQKGGNQGGLESCPF